MSISDLGWGLLAAMNLNSGKLSTWFPDWPKWIYLLVMLLLLIEAFAFYRFHALGWVLAFLYILVGVVSLISQLLAMLIQVDGFLFLFPAIGIVSLPYLFYRRNEFF